MKNILGALAAVLICCFTACETAKTPIVLNYSDTAFTTSGSTTETKTMTATLTNTTTTSGAINWSFMETTAVNGWKYTITINGTLQSGTSGSFEITGNGEATVVLTATGNNISGTGVAELVFKDNARDLGKITYTYTTAPATPKFSISKTADAGAHPSNTQVDYKTVLTNLTSNPLEIKWVRTANANNPAAWSYVTCDHLICYPPAVYTKQYTIDPNATIEFKTTVVPNNTAGNGKVTMNFFLPSDSVGTSQSYVITHLAN